MSTRHPARTVEPVGNHARTGRARWLGRMGVAVLLVGAAALGVVPAQAATTGTWAGWAPLAGTANAYSGSVTLAAAPALSATYTSDSRAGQVGVISGDTTWLSEGTPVGAKYGSSRGRPYLNLRPKADSATGASTTTYTFSRPTPTSNWTFVLGDIDADQVTIRAVGPDGAALTAAQLGYRGGFNYCAPGVAGKPSCTGDAADVPSWNPSTMTLTGNPAAADTSGAAGWFEPTAPISSLTFAYLRRSGFPVFQTWFATLARDVTGTVTDVADGPLGGVTVRLVDQSGAVVATTTTASGSGAYAFTGVQATSGYTVEIAPPAGKVAVDATRKPADLTSADAVVPFQVRAIVPVPVSGTVRDTDGNPIGGATVTLSGGGAPLTTTTASDGTYLFDTVPVGTHQVSVTAPDGYLVATAPAPFTVPAGSEDPITGQDFVLDAAPTLSGRVTAGASGVPGVTVTATSAGRTYSTVTGADGRYSFPRITPDGYQVATAAPAGYAVVGPASRAETVGAADVTDVDFALVRAGSIAGSVVDGSGAPVPGATVTITGAGGPYALVTDAAGDYALEGLEPGTYTATVTAPDGYEVSGSAAQTVTITAAGESRDAPFELTALATPTPTPSGGTTPSSGPQAPGGGALSDTGGGDVGPTLALGVALAALGAILVATGSLVRARRR